MSEPQRRHLNDQPLVHIHSWREWYANLYTKMRECYECEKIQELAVGGSWNDV